MPDPRSPVQHTIALRRVDPDTNVARFYVLPLERDLFGKFAVTRQWGRVATAGRVITEPFGTEVESTSTPYAAGYRVHTGNSPQTRGPARETPSPAIASGLCGLSLAGS